MLIDAVLAVRNQASSIASLIDGLAVPGLRRVTVVDRASEDDTAERARAHGATVLLGGQIGIGAAYQLACRDLAQLPVLPDALLIAPETVIRVPGALAPLIAEVGGGADLVVAVPRRGPLGRALMINAIRKIYGRGLLVGATFAIRWPAWVALGMNTAGDSWWTALTVRALRLGLQVVEVPYADEPTTSTVGPADLYQLARHATLR